MNLSKTAILLVLALVASLPAIVQAQHRFIGCDKKQLTLVGEDGSVEWQMKLGGNIHDIGQLESGNYLIHQGTTLQEIDPKEKKVVWQFDARTLCGAKKVEVHSCQPIPGDRFFVAVSGEGKIFEIDREGKVHHTIILTLNDPHPHSDTRLVRRLENGHYLVAHERDGWVREYDRESNVAWDFEIPDFGKEKKGGHGPEAFGTSVFSAVRLANGNTLIGTGNGHSILEVTPEKEIAWKIEQNDLEGITLAWVTTLEALPNGNIVIGNCHAGDKNPQLVEVTREKKVVWSYHNWEHFGNALSNSMLLGVEGVRR